MLWTVVLEKTLESPLDCKEIQPVHPKGNQSWIFIGRTDAEAETRVLWPRHAKSWLIGKDSDAGRGWGQEEKGTTEDEMAGWHHWLDELEFEWTPGVGDGQGGLVCCNSWGRKESDTTERLNWTEVFVSPGSVFRSRIAELCCKWFFNLIWNCQSFPEWLYHFVFLWVVSKISCCSVSSEHGIVWVFLFLFCHFNRSWLYLIVVLICVSLTNDFEHISIFLLLTSSLVKFLVNLCPFLKIKFSYYCVFKVLVLLNFSYVSLCLLWPLKFWRYTFISILMGIKKFHFIINYESNCRWSVNRIFMVSMVFMCTIVFESYSNLGLYKNSCVV